MDAEWKETDDIQRDDSDEVSDNAQQATHACLTNAHYTLTFLFPKVLYVVVQ